MTDPRPQSQFPRVLRYLAALPKDALMRWLTDSAIGKRALAALERKLSADKAPGGD